MWYKLSKVHEMNIFQDLAVTKKEDRFLLGQKKARPDGDQTEPT